MRCLSLYENNQITIGYDKVDLADDNFASAYSTSAGVFAGIWFSLAARIAALLTVQNQQQSGRKRTQTESGERLAERHLSNHGIKRIVLKSPKIS
jgi:hypothetical protein